MPGSEALARRLAAIADGPQGPKVAAFFDFDGTLIDGFSAGAYLKQRIRRRELGLREAGELLTFSLTEQPSDTDFHELIEASVRRWAGLAEADFAALWQKLFTRQLAAKLFPEAWTLVKAHQRAGHTVAIASSATRWQIEPAARELGITQVLATPVQVRDGALTGRLAGAPLWGEGKAEAVRAFAARAKLDLGASYGYANGDEDIAFLASLGRPMAVNPRPRLVETAVTAGWPIADFASRRLGLRERLRSAGFYAGMSGSFLAGVAAHRLGAEHRQALNFVVSTATEVGLALGGIRLNVQGEENLWKARPAVFIFNHQSPLDLIVGLNLLRRDCTGVVKAEMGQMFGWGAFARFMDLALVDRADPDKAIAALKPAVDKLKAGMSLGICPEGTRSYSPKLGAFKKGAFHMAMQAGVPIVPVVMRNAGALMSRDAHLMRAGTLDICVLPPVDTRDWTRESMDARIAAIHRRYEELLSHWPRESVSKDWTVEAPMAEAPKPAARRRRVPAPA